MEIPAEQHKENLAYAHIRNPLITTTNPKDRSDLYDSFELQAVMKQLNRAIEGSKAPLSPSSYYLNSPCYRRRLAHIYKENAKAPRKISGSMNNNGGVEMITTARKCKGLQHLWRKVKQTFVARTKFQES